MPECLPVNFTCEVHSISSPDQGCDQREHPNRTARTDVNFTPSNTPNGA